MPFHVYLLRCADNSLYCGFCKDLQARKEMHNVGKGAKYTRSRRPVNIVYTEEFTTRSEALRREAHIKKLTKAAKELLVARN
ncbi:MAG TPA: GIY-YIG nuclease family protein [Candidatus Peribacteraceae bacterium]|nr:GIY-YIG nuclease family protein [Candidatus Peribacteraceae bacterium]